MSQTKLFSPTDIISASTVSAKQVVYAVQDKFEETDDKDDELGGW
jgi:hypothetical protein